MTPALARTKQRYVSEDEELRRWRDGLDQALRRRRRSFARRLFRTLVVVLVLSVALGGAAGAFFWQQINSRLRRTAVELPAPAGPARNILVIGSDSRSETRSKEDVKRFGRVQGRRADTIILVQVVPSQQRAVLLHFPRDLWVKIPGRGSAKINTAYEAGPQTLIDTVQLISGVPVNHYVEVDINGFRNMVSAIGGIDVCLDRALRDSLLNFRLPAGPNHLDGNEALSFVRSRHSTGDGDFGRIRRQQQFLRAVVSKVGRPSVLLNPIRLNNLATAFASNVTADHALSIAEALPLAGSVRSFGPEQLQTYTVPGDISRAGGQSVVQMDADRAEVLFAAMRDVADPKERLAPAPVALAVEDASGSALRGQRAADELEARGFVIIRRALAGKTQTRTQIVTPRTLANDAKRVQAVVPSASILYGGTEIRLIVGSGFRGVAPEQKGEEPAPGGPCAGWTGG